ETVYGNATAVATRELQILPSTHGDQSGVIGSAAMILDHVQVCRSYGRFDLTDSYRIGHDGSDVVVFVALDPERSQGRRQCPYTRSVGLPHRRSPVQATAWRHAGIRALVIATRESIG